MCFFLLAKSATKKNYKPSRTASNSCSCLTFRHISAQLFHLRAGLDYRLQSAGGLACEYCFKMDFYNIQTFFFKQSKQSSFIRDPDRLSRCLLVAAAGVMTGLKVRGAGDKKVNSSISGSAGPSWMRRMKGPLPHHRRGAVLERSPQQTRRCCSRSDCLMRATSRHGCVEVCVSSS